ncbi:hypothetical protein DM01DRAFT_1337504 [Hesseltinella vesiculosa]|uniref:Uncharacterized protein n=1 Tax=Hesseltinella vesiculosa TaxID=101127 RepID=A0A1X2GCU6_9FUNG|nr:hypothetical protein DM01DRAFT_1337504 [Hesseltinella vesiculosa]
MEFADDEPLAPRRKVKSLSLNRKHEAHRQPSPDPFLTSSTLPRDWNDPAETAASISCIPSRSISLPAPAQPTAATFEEYQCPICNKDLSHLKSSFGRQQHVDHCLAGLSCTSPNIHDDGNTDNDLARTCLFCAKNVQHLKGSHLEHHYERCLARLDNAAREERNSTFAGQASFLKQLTACPVCHDSLPSRSLRTNMAHMKRCGRDHQLTMVQLMRKIQWMQWGHVPMPMPPSSSTSSLDTPSSASCSTSIPKQSKNAIVLDRELEEDDDFSDQVIVYRVTTSLRSKPRSPSPDEEEQLAMALSLSMHEDARAQLPIRRRKAPINLNAANIVTMEESRSLACLSLARLIEKHRLKAVPRRESSAIPLVTSKLALRSSTTTLWEKARMLD